MSSRNRTLRAMARQKRRPDVAKVTLSVGPGFELGVALRTGGDGGGGAAGGTRVSDPDKGGPHALSRSLCQEYADFVYEAGHLMQSVHMQISLLADHSSHLSLGFVLISRINVLFCHTTTSQALPPHSVIHVYENPQKPEEDQQSVSWRVTPACGVGHQPRTLVAIELVK